MSFSQIKSSKVNLQKQPEEIYHHLYDRDFDGFYEGFNKTFTIKRTSFDQKKSVWSCKTYSSFMTRVTQLIYLI